VDICGESTGVGLPTELPALVRELRERHGVPAMSVGVLRDGEVAVLSDGLARLESSTPNSADTLFEIGSITKIYTATAVMRLIDRGLIDLSTRAIDVVPEFTLAEGGGRDITVGHLLSHTCGIDPDFYGDPNTPSIADLVSQLRTTRPRDSAGAQWGYSNCGYVLLGLILERISGRSFAEVLRTEVLDPVGDDVTRGHDTAGLRAVGYERDPKEPRLLNAHPPGQMPAFAPAGSTPASTPAAVLKLVKVHCNDGVTDSGVRLLSADATRAMRAQHVRVPTNARRQHAWGLGWAHYELTDGRLVLGHGGSTYGFLSYLIADPSQGMAVVIMVNAMHAAPVMVDIGEFLLRELLGAGLHS